MGRKRAPKSTQNEDADRDHVRSEDGDESQGPDGVEGHGRANVDQRKEARDGKRKKNCIKRDVPAGLDLDVEVSRPCMLPEADWRTYMSDEAGEGQAIVSRKGPRLSGDSCDSADTGRRDVNDDDGRHYRGARVIVGGVEEDLDEWIASGRCDDGGEVAQCKAEGDGHDESQRTIDGSRSHNGARKHKGSIFDFLSHMHC